MVPAATNFLIPATVAALAGSQPLPQVPMTALVSFSGPFDDGEALEFRGQAVRGGLCRMR
ncbi:MAG: hypothetical protein NTV52_27630 [Acidobacteria bacterium]|nr:hypothetical protein [Acidobacteriota bacterium]